MTAADDPRGRLARLEEQMRQITDRLAALEQPARQPEPAAPARQWHLGTLPGPGRPATGEPAFLIEGHGQFGGGPIMMRQQASLSDVLDTDPDAAAKIFAALASPARITVLRALLDGPRTSQQLRTELDDASVGQLYHHLRELLAAGLIIQPARSRYAIPRNALIMLCAQLIAAGRLASSISLPIPPDEGHEGHRAQPQPGDADPP